MGWPLVDAVAFSIGPLDIRWYSLAYMVGIIAGWRLALYWALHYHGDKYYQAIDATISWATLGVILGGRLGYVFFYNWSYYSEYPLKILYLWQGGMSFHGGMIGVIVALFLQARHYKLQPLIILDLAAAVAPIGLFFGRIANFINGELYGRETDMPWGIRFQGAGDAPRHPSQLYEAVLEGLVLFLVLYFFVTRRQSLRYPGMIGGMFLVGYAIARIMVELFREPDAHIGFVMSGLTMGQILTIPMVLAGFYFILHARHRDAVY